MNKQEKNKLIGVLNDLLEENKNFYLASLWTNCENKNTSPINQIR